MNHFFKPRNVCIRLYLLEYVYGQIPGDVEKDQEGLANMENLGRNMAYLLTALEGRRYSLGKEDDFMEKPLELQECLLRTQALLGRYSTTAPPLPGQQYYTIVTSENLTIDSLTRHVIQGTGIGFDLLYLLSSQVGQVLTHEQLLYYVMGRGFFWWGNQCHQRETSAAKAGRRELHGKRLGVSYRFIHRVQKSNVYHLGPSCQHSQAFLILGQTLRYLLFCGKSPENLPIYSNHTLCMGRGLGKDNAIIDKLEQYKTHF